VEAIADGRFALVINTTSTEATVKESFSMRRAALDRKIPYCTVLSAARAMVAAIEEAKLGPWELFPLPSRSVAGTPGSAGALPVES
jgi:carbamoyl-phosphate synthase large subunit